MLFIWNGGFPGFRCGNRPWKKEGSLGAAAPRARDIIAEAFENVKHYFFFFRYFFIVVFFGARGPLRALFRRFGERREDPRLCCRGAAGPEGRACLLRGFVL